MSLQEERRDGDGYLFDLEHFVLVSPAPVAAVATACHLWGLRACEALHGFPWHLPLRWCHHACLAPPMAPAAMQMHKDPSIVARGHKDRLPPLPAGCEKDEEHLVIDARRVGELLLLPLGPSD